MLHLQHLSKEFAGKPLFTDISWHLKKGERVGLVGENGAGKSTLMRIIAGDVEHSAGELIFAKGATVGYLPQDGIVTRGRTLFAEAMGALERVHLTESLLRVFYKKPAPAHVREVGDKPGGKWGRRGGSPGGGEGGA